MKKTFKNTVKLGPLFGNALNPTHHAPTAIYTIVTHPPHTLMPLPIPSSAAALSVGCRSGLQSAQLALSRGSLPLRPSQPCESDSRPLVANSQSEFRRAILLFSKKLKKPKELKGAPDPTCSSTKKASL